MNNKEFREKCREIICQQLNELDEFFKGNKDYGFDPDVAKSVALLYIAANMPSSNEGAKKPCTFCGGTKYDTTISHYIYIDSKHKQLVDVCDGIVTRTAIKYCPMCGRKL